MTAPAVLPGDQYEEDKIAINSSLSGAGNTAQGMSYQNFNSFQNCSSQIEGCDAAFYIRDGKVLETKPGGKCYTGDTVRSEPGWERFTRK